MYLVIIIMNTCDFTDRGEVGEDVEVIEGGGVRIVMTYVGESIEW
jgi:hypothetical protein